MPITNTFGKLNGRKTLYGITREDAGRRGSGYGVAFYYPFPYCPHGAARWVFQVRIK
jgi:hypothetical protein